MAQLLFTTKLVVSAAAPIDLEIGFQPGRVLITNDTAIATPTNAEVFRSEWQYNMASGSADIWTYNASLLPLITRTASNGISLLGFGSSASAEYGPVISGFTNANPGVISVNDVTGYAAGDVIRVAGLADDQAGTQSLNGVYTVGSVSAAASTITVTANTTGYSAYISGGFVTQISNANATTPNPPNSIYSNVPTVFNQAFMGIRIGTACLANSSANDVLLIAAWDMNSGGL